MLKPFSGYINTHIVELEEILEGNRDSYTPEELMTMELDMQALAYIADLWEEFGDALMDPHTECMEEDWHQFPAGTHREDIWHWFESYFGVSVAENMMGMSR